MGVALTALSRVTSAACGVPGTWLLVFSPGDGHGPVERWYARLLGLRGCLIADVPVLRFLSSCRGQPGFYADQTRC
jgi:hypothetical protein